MLGRAHFGREAGGPVRSRLVRAVSGWKRGDVPGRPATHDRGLLPAADRADRPVGMARALPELATGVAGMTGTAFGLG